MSLDDGENDRKVTPFRARGKSREEVDAIRRKVAETSAPLPADGLVLACCCGGTLHEMVNGGFIRCGRCGRSPHGLHWRSDPPPAPKE